MIIEGKTYSPVYLAEVDSTNNYLKNLLQEGDPKEGVVVMADYQTGGRGQRGNSWFSSKGDNLLFSLLLTPTMVKANEQFILSRIVSLAVKKMLDPFLKEIRIKWPNDIYCQDRKIAGMLIENDLDGTRMVHSVVGIGINVNQSSFPDHLPNPVSMRQITGRVYDRERLLMLFLREFTALYLSFESGATAAIEEEYMFNLYRQGDYHWFEDANGVFRAQIRHVLPSGHIVLHRRDTGKEQSYAFKEIVFINGK